MTSRMPQRANAEQMQTNAPERVATFQTGVSPASLSRASSSTTVNTGSGHTKICTEDRRLIQRILIDLLLFIVLLMPIIICEFVVMPFQRGFFCNDETIRYPFHPNTVTPVILAVIVFVVPFLAFIVIEITRFCQRGRMSDAILIFGWKAPTWLLECTKQIWYFAVGAVLVLDATEIGKYTIGRLRPHFITVCQPQLLDGSSCQDVQNQYRYIERFICQAQGFTASDILEARRSFPSGHSSMSSYAMVYVAIYVHMRVTWRGSKLTRHFLQFVALMTAWFTALSRVMDYWHHWSDVLVGSLFGIVGAVLTAHYIAKLTRNRSEYILSMRRSEVLQPENQSKQLQHQQSQHGKPQQIYNLDSMKLSLPRQDTATTTLDEIVISSTPPPYSLRDGHGIDQFDAMMTTPSNSFSTIEQCCTKV